ncbi:hypothetical protein KSP39_PZI003080 [Platanthera zijinensis]|uniref:Uncharacterized protein n=1 Tax=Platanthera zijinensis TaxID=2320716 RepID=A0AAP0GDL8_9ASPA
MKYFTSDRKYFIFFLVSFAAHYRHNQDEYRAAVSDFLSKARLIFSNRQLYQNANKKMPESVAAIDSNESLRRFTFEPTDHFVQSSTEFSEIRSGVSPVDEQKSGLFQIPSIKPQGVLSQILFDVCVPKNIEGWDIKPISSLNSAHRRRPFNPIKCIRRSRL